MTKTSKKKHFPDGYWKGKIGLERAKEEMLKVAKNLRRTPKREEIKGYAGIKNTIARGEWANYGINSWADYRNYCGLKKNPHYNVKWKGILGLEKAKKLTLDFYYKNKKIPTGKDLPKIESASKSGVWAEFDITTWNKFLKYCGFKPNLEHGKWHGDMGLKKAIERIQDYYQENNKVPPRDAILSAGIRGAIKKGYWPGIESWNDLIKKAGFEPIKIDGYWDGEEGLKNAKDYVYSFIDKNGRVPTNKEIKGIVDKCRFGEWPNIHSYNDFLEHVGVGIQSEWGKWHGIEGLQKARKQAEEFVKQNGRSPTREDIKGIESAALRGHWKKFGVFSWNSFLLYCGIPVGHELGKWKGIKGLERAKTEILMVSKKIGRTPIRTDLSESIGLFGAIYRGEWEDYGIKRYNDLVKKCGLEPNVGIYGDAWEKWEDWCEQAISHLFKGNFNKKKRLKNNKVPDFYIKLKVDKILIIDAKLSTYTEGIRRSKKNYLEYCYKLEFWCLFGEKKSLVHNGKIVNFLSPGDILSKIKDKQLIEQLRNELKDVYAYARSSLDELDDVKGEKEIIQTQLSDFLG